MRVPMATHGPTLETKNHPQSAPWARKRRSACGRAVHVSLAQGASDDVDLSSIAPPRLRRQLEAWRTKQPCFQLEVRRLKGGTAFVDGVRGSDSESVLSLMLQVRVGRQSAFKFPLGRSTLS